MQNQTPTFTQVSSRNNNFYKSIINSEHQPSAMTNINLTNYHQELLKSDTLNVYNDFSSQEDLFSKLIKENPEMNNYEKFMSKKYQKERHRKNSVQKINLIKQKLEAEETIENKWQLQIGSQVQALNKNDSSDFKKLESVSCSSKHTSKKSRFFAKDSKESSSDLISIEDCSQSQSSSSLKISQQSKIKKDLVKQKNQKPILQDKRYFRERKNPQNASKKMSDLKLNLNLISKMKARRKSTERSQQRKQILSDDKSYLQLDGHQQKTKSTRQIVRELLDDVFDIDLKMNNF